MEGIGGVGFGSMNATTRKKRSNTPRRPWNEAQPLSEFHDGSSLSSSAPSDNDVNKVEDRDPKESDEGSSNSSFQGSNHERDSGVGTHRPTDDLLTPTDWKISSTVSDLETGSDVPGNENKVKKVKLKVGGITKTLNAKSISDGDSGVRSSSTKSSRISNAPRLRQRNSGNSDDHSITSDDVSGLPAFPWKGFSRSGTNVRKAGYLTDKLLGDDPLTKRTDAHQPIRKSLRISRKRVPEEELNDTDDDDDEIRYLEKVRTAKVTAMYDDDEEGRNIKHRKLSKVMKQNFYGNRNSEDASSRSGKQGKKQKSKQPSDDADYVEEEEEEEAVSDGEQENKRTILRKRAADLSVESKKEMTVVTRQRALQTGNDVSSRTGGSVIEFRNGLPPAPPRKQKEKLSELEQQVKKAEAAQRRRMQVEKVARESEAEAIRKILGQDSTRKKREEKIKKHQEEKAKEKAANSIALQSDTVRWVMGPTGTVVTFSDELGLPPIFDSKPCSYPPPRERCAGPSCTNPYKYRDSKSKLPLCSLQCYKALHGKTASLSAC